MKQRLTSTVAGFSMIEVMVTVFILIIGILGVSGAQLGSLKNNQGAYHRSQGTMLANDIIDRMRGNFFGLTNGNYDSIDTTSVSGSSVCSAAGGCTASALATMDAQEWAAQFGVLPAGQGTVTVTHAGTIHTATVNVQWSENENGAAATKNVQVVVRI